MPKRKGRTSSALILGRALATIASGLSSTWNAYARPRRQWQVTVGRLEPSGEELTKLNLTGPRTMCDHCNVAHARFIVKWGESYELHLCGHHWKRHAFALGARGAVVTELPDES
jgi:hypothetical protein